MCTFIDISKLAIGKCHEKDRAWTAVAFSIEARCDGCFYGGPCNKLNTKNAAKPLHSSNILNSHMILYSKWSKYDRTWRAIVMRTTEVSQYDFRKYLIWASHSWMQTNILWMASDVSQRYSKSRILIVNCTNFIPRRSNLNKWKCT